jgi:putative addiction module component (TIGR02574 family)
MPMTKEQLLAEAMKLDPKESDELVLDIWQRGSGDFTPEQMDELNRRLEVLNRGEVQTIPGEQVMKELRERFRR